MRLLICAGGTGGGVYPALAVLQAMSGNVEVLWVGGEGGMEAQLVERNGIPFRSIPAAGVHGVGLRTLPRNLWQLGRGYLAARRILGQFKPDVLFFTGGYVAVPMALAGRKVPSLLYVPDIEPGLALKTLARFASRIAVTADESAGYFGRMPSPRRPSPEGSKARFVRTGYPTRRDLAKWTKPEARRSLGLDDRTPVLLVFGGSKGARSINTALLKVLPDLLEQAQVIHITGELDWPEVQAKVQQLAPAQAARYHAYPYLHEEMGAALASADLALSRAGASSLGEYPLFGLPAVLVPYPYAWRYQKVNADYLVRQGAAVLLEDEKMTEQLLPVLRGLLGDAGKLAALQAAMRRLAAPEAAARIGGLLAGLAGERSADRG